jgi:hypothetical protein
VKSRHVVANAIDPQASLVEPIASWYVVPSGAFGRRNKQPVDVTAMNSAGETEVTILARVLGNEEGQLPPEIARYLLQLGFSDRDKDRMHDLAVRNQEDALSAEEKEELFAYAKAGTLLSILQSKARRVLKLKPKKRTTS